MHHELRKHSLGCMDTVVVRPSEDRDDPRPLVRIWFHPVGDRVEG
jgi:hypothetical protein